MPPITWRNVQGVNAPNFGSELYAAQKSGQDLGNAFKGLGTNVQNFADAKQKQETDEFIAHLNSLSTDQERNQALLDANDAFLNVGRANEAITAAQNQDFDVAKRNEEKTLFDQAQNVFASDAPLRQANLTNNLLTANNLNTTETRTQQSLNNAPVYERAELEIANMPPGPERASKIQEKIKELSKLPGTKTKDIDTLFSSYHDDNLLNTPVSIDQYSKVLPKLNFTDRENVPSSTAISTYTNKLRKAVKKDNRFATDAAVSDKVSEILSDVPGYAQSAIDAAAIKKSTDKVIDVKVEKAGKVQENKQELEIAVAGGSPAGDLTKLLQKNYPLIYSEDKISASRLESVLSNTWDNVQKEYASELFNGKIAEKDLLESVYKMFTSSSTSSPWYYLGKDIVSSAKGNGIAPDRSMERITGQNIRKSLNDFLPGGLRNKLLPEEEIKKQEEREKKEQVNSTTKVLEKALNKKIKPDKDGDIVLGIRDIIKLLNPF